MYKRIICHISGDKKVYILVYTSLVLLFLFKCGTQDLDIVDKHVYLGLTFRECLEFNVTAKIVSQSAALGLLIAKFKALGGMPFEVLTKLYDSLV